MSDGPKKYETDPTMPSVGRMTALGPVSVREAFVETIQPTDEEREALLDALRLAEREAITLVSCPACKECDFCYGAHLVEPEKAAAFASMTPGPAPKDEPK